ncbi:MAG: hypothetical protein JOY71_08780 [Acetobacteraceae bacterium]|nr:hypothetical protein [Acetobacteraceae bacterium]MBV8522206.1 hypothetical protein [Acetobacteraceae bacterium]
MRAFILKGIGLLVSLAAFAAAMLLTVLTVQRIKSGREPMTPTYRPTWFIWRRMSAGGSMS